jgi:integrase
MLSSDMPRRLPPGCVEDVDKKYNVIRVYFRPKKGVKKIRIRGAPWTPEFMEAYDAAKGGVERQKRIGAKPGTWGYLCARYMAESADFKRLDPGTRHARKLILDSMCQEPIAPGSDRTFNDFPLARMTADDIEVLRDRKIDFPEAANGRVKAARQVCKFGVKKKHIKSNIARDVEYFRSGSTGFHTWTVEEVQQFEARHPIGTKARLALALLCFTGQRRSDIIRFGRQHVRNGLLTFTQHKGRNRKPKRLILPILPVLREVIDASPCGELTFLINDLGRAFTDAGIGNKVREWCDQAGLPHCTAHGLRKAGATISAENGATARQLMAVFGWDSKRQAELYTRAADQKRMAGDAMHLIEPVGPVFSGSGTFRPEDQ